MSPADLVVLAACFLNNYDQRWDRLPPHKKSLNLDLAWGKQLPWWRVGASYDCSM